MDRKAFLGRLLLGGAGLVVGDEALERYARLTHVRKSFPSAGVYPNAPTGLRRIPDQDGQPWAAVLTVPTGVSASRLRELVALQKGAPDDWGLPSEYRTVFDPKCPPHMAYFYRERLPSLT